MGIIWYHCFMDIRAFKLSVPSGEEIVGSEKTGSHACYMIYGILEPKEKGRVICPGEGHEEIVLCIKGKMLLSGHYEGLLKEGYAFHIKGQERCLAENPSDETAIYVIAGGHSGGWH